MVVMEKQAWGSLPGDTVRAWFAQPQPGLPQMEPMFDVVSVPFASFDGHLKGYRNILAVRISNQADSATLRYKESPWSRTQRYFEISAPDTASFFKLFDANKEKISAVFLDTERNRLVSAYKNKPDNSLQQFFRENYRLNISFPPEYTLNKNENGLVWISRETKTDSRGVIFFQENYTRAGQLTAAGVVTAVNARLKAQIPGPSEGSYMALDTLLPVDTMAYSYAGEHYALLLKSIWIVENDFMGGPYILNVVLDKKNERVLYFMGYVYAPDDKKRNRIRQVEAILFTMNLEE